MSSLCRTKIKNMLSSNLLIYDMLTKMYYRRFNSDLEKCVNKLREIDAIEDFDAFREAMLKTEFPKTNGTYTFKRAYSENTLYGYAESIMSYAGIDWKDVFYFPIVLHGVPYNDEFDLDKFSFNNSFVFQGTADALRVKTRYPAKRVYSIGPYLAYTTPYYDTEKTELRKSALKNTALLFLNHSDEKETADFQINRQIDTIQNVFKKSYDTYMVCVYCQDVDKICEEDLKKQNVMYVSAGYKLDPLFCARLKTILELSDDVYFEGFSSSIGYAYFLKKGVYSLSKYDSENTKETRKDRFSRIFGVENNSTDEEKTSFIDQYWGLSQIQAPQEIAEIFKENKKRIKKSMGFERS